MEGIKSSPVILYCSYSSPCGDLLLGATEDRLCLCDWKTRPNQEKIFQRLNRYLNAEWREGNPGILQKASCQLDEYFSGKRETFDIPLLIIGSPFQQEVWKLLQKIPYGSTLSYCAQAQRLQKPSAIRAVASANGANALSIFIPCHRVIGQNGQLTDMQEVFPQNNIYWNWNNGTKISFHSFRQFIKFRNNQIRVPDKIEKPPPPSVLLFLVSG